MVVVDKSSGRFKELTTIGVASTSEEIAELEVKAQRWIDHYGGQQTFDFEESEKAMEEIRRTISMIERTLQNAPQVILGHVSFSNITYLCPQRPDMAEKLKAKRTPFSRQCVSPTLLSNIGMKAFRKSVFLKDIKRYQNIRRQLFRKWLIVNILSKATCNRNYLEGTSIRQKSVNSYIAS